MLRSIWKDWIVPIFPQVAAGIVVLRLEEHGDGVTEVLSNAAPRLAMVAVACLMTYGLIRAADAGVSMLLSMLPSKRFRALLERVEKHVRAETDELMEFVLRTDLDKKRRRQLDREFREKPTGMSIGGPQPGDPKWVSFLEDLCLCRGRGGLKRARREFPPTGNNPPSG